MFYEE